MWPIEEYAISRLMLVCGIAASAPNSIEAIEISSISNCHWCDAVPNGPAMTRSSSAKAAIFGAPAMNEVTGGGAP